MPTSLVIGDPHFKASNAKDVEEFISKVVGKAKETSPDFIVVLGDILHDHERLHVSPLNNAVRFLLELKNVSPTYLLIGNHDMINNSQFLTTQHAFNCLKGIENLHIIDSVVHHEIQGVDFLFTPYVPPGRFREALQTCEYPYMDANVIFAHQEFRGCLLKDIKSEHGDDWPEENPLVISGHIHGRQTPQPNLIYPGTAMQHTFGEPDDKGISLFNFIINEDFEFEERIIDLNLPRRVIIEFNVDDPPPEIDTRNYTKLIVSGSYEKFKAFRSSDKYSQLVKSGVKIAFRHKKEKLEKQEATKVSYTSVLRDVLINKCDSYISKVYSEIFKETLVNIDFVDKE